MAAGQLFPPDLQRTIQAKVVSPYIIGDPAYGLKVNVMKGFVGSGNPRPQTFFTYMLLSARQCVECAFGRLKGRWRILQAPSQYKSVEDHCSMVGACCVLHNMCQLAKDPFAESWKTAGTLSQPYQEYYNVFDQQSQTIGTVLSTPVLDYQIRDALVTEMALDMPPDCAPPNRR